MVNLIALGPAELDGGDILHAGHLIVSDEVGELGVVLLQGVMVHQIHLAVPDGEIRVSNGVVVPVLLHHNAVHRLHAVLLQQGIEVGEVFLFGGSGHHQQLAAVLGVLGQHIPLLHGDIRGGGIDHQAVGVLRDVIHGEQGEGIRLHVRLFDLLGEARGQLTLPVSLQEIQLGQFLVDHIVNGGGDGSLPVERGVIGVGVDIHFADIDVLIGHVAEPIATLHNEAVVGHRLVGVLLGEGGVHVRVFLHHLDVVGQALVFAQQVFDDVVLLPRLHHPVDGHVLFQGVDHHLGVAGDGVELGGAHVISTSTTWRSATVSPVTVRCSSPRPSSSSPCSKNTAS